MRYYKNKNGREYWQSTTSMNDVDMVEITESEYREHLEELRTQLSEERQESAQ